MKSSGWTMPRSGCCQRISASTPVGLMSPQVERRLVGEQELLVRERFAQVHLEFHAVLDRVLHAGLEHDVAILAVPLGPVHRDVGVAQQLLGRGVLARGDPDARGDGQARLFVGSELERLLQRVEQALGDQLGAGGQGKLLGDHDELVSTQRPSASASRTAPPSRAATARRSSSPTP